MACHRVCARCRRVQPNLFAEVDAPLWCFYCDGAGLTPNDNEKSIHQQVLELERSRQ